MVEVFEEVDRPRLTRAGRNPSAEVVAVLRTLDTQKAIVFRGDCRQFAALRNRLHTGARRYGCRARTSIRLVNLERVLVAYFEPFVRRLGGC